MDVLHIIQFTDNIASRTVTAPRNQGPDCLEEAPAVAGPHRRCPPDIFKMRVLLKGASEHDFLGYDCG